MSPSITGDVMQFLTPRVLYTVYKWHESRPPNHVVSQSVSSVAPDINPVHQ